MSNNEEVQMVVLMDAGRPGVLRVPGTVVVTANCGHQGLISPSTVAFMATPEGVGAHTICTTCMGREAMAQTSRTELLPGMDAELVSVFGVAVADQLMALARDRGLALRTRGHHDDT